jgi:hypothetical protein
MLLGLSHLSYDIRLPILGIENLELRRLKQYLIMAYKILYGLTEMDTKELISLTNVGHDTRGHAYNLFQGHCLVDVRKSDFTKRVAEVWNSLLQNEVTLMASKPLRVF